MDYCICTDYNSCIGRPPIFCLKIRSLQNSTNGRICSIIETSVWYWVVRVFTTSQFLPQNLFLYLLLHEPISCISRLLIIGHKIINQIFRNNFWSQWFQLELTILFEFSTYKNYDVIFFFKIRGLQNSTNTRVYTVIKTSVWSWVTRVIWETSNHTVKISR